MSVEIPKDPEQRRRYFFDLVREDQTRKRRRRAELAEIVKNVPVTDDVLAEIAWGWSDLLQHHPGFTVEEKIRALSGMVRVFKQAHGDLIAQLDRFDLFSSSSNFLRKAGREELLSIETAVDKELMTFSTAAMSLVDHVRAVRTSITVTELDAKRTEVFDLDEHGFITGLRNMISHGHFPDLGWSLKYGEKRETHFLLLPERLLRANNIGQNAKRFIEKCGDRVEIRTIADCYSAKVGKFYDWYLPALDASATPALLDYRRCKRICLQTSSRTWHRVMVHHYIQWKVDPYAHLSKYLTPEEIEGALKLPMRSKEQIDYIIAAVDEHDACDDELRGMVYKLFRLGEPIN